MSPRSRSVTARSVLAVPLVVVLLALGACSDDQAASDPVSTASTGTVEPRLDCVALIPDDAVVALGWAPGDPAEEDAGRCLRRVDESGAVSVATRTETLEEACAALRARGDSVTEPVDWLEPTRAESCVSSPGQAGVGVSELLFVNDTDEVVQVRVEALTPVDTEQLRAAFGAVADAARQDVDG